MEKNDLTTILIVDDNAGNIFALEELLNTESRVLLNATNGNDALKIVLTQNIDLIILDVQMPGMDGFEVAQILKSNKKTKDIPIIFASAERKERQFIMKGFEEGAVDYLFKPLDPEITKAKVAVLLKLQLQKKELIEKNLALQKADEQIKQLNLELQQNLSQLEATNHELESFSYSVSHDLRAPLRAINGYSKILEEEYLHQFNEDSKHLLEIIQENAIKMGKLIDDLLEFSRLGRKELRTTEINMNEMVEHIVNEINKSALYKFGLQLNDLLPAQADYSLLTQVWINLVSNAAKYSSKKDDSAIEIGCYDQENEIVYYVKDNGAGFNMEYADKLFGVFQRLHSTQEFEGTGVGLAIVQRIIIKHGGRIWAESEVNKGATFSFSLPKSQIKRS
jgi:two-component system, sensor histidine kinase and response regulator